MLGRSITELDAVVKSKVEHEQRESGERVLEAKGLGLKGTLEPVDLDLGVNEVLGVAGLLGSGRTEMANLLFGVDKPDAGTLEQLDDAERRAIETRDLDVEPAPRPERPEGAP